MKYPKTKFNDSKWRRDVLTEDKMDSTKMFDQSTINKIVNDIKKLANYKKEQYGNQSFDYNEFRFGDGTGGFGFKWYHARNWGGQVGVSFSKNGMHKYYNYSWYDKNKTGKATVDSMKSFKFKGMPMVWSHFTNDHLLEFWNNVKGDIKRNETGARAALDKEAKAQSDYYGKKANTGRIGYGLR